VSTDLPDLALRTLGGAVIAASDEFFADKENLIKPAAPEFMPRTWSAKGQVYDGWETRRRREPGHDWALVRLGMPGIPRTVVVDTAHFTGNYPPHCSVEAASVDGYPSPAELLDTADWLQLVPRSPLSGNSRHEFAVAGGQWFTHVRLSIYPDGGVARLRVLGEPLPDPRELPGLPLDLAALRTGGRTVACSDSFFSGPDSMLQPGESRFMGDGWETARRRDGGNDWAVVALAGRGVPSVVELATTHYKGNSPDRAALFGVDARTAAELDDAGAWFPVLPATRLQPDTTHCFRLAGASGGRPVTHVRLDIHPDGGVARLRVYGQLTPDGYHDLALRWFNALPPAHARSVLAEAGLDAHLAASRPLTALPPPVLAACG
jgi:allantoicase